MSDFTEDDRERMAKWCGRPDGIVPYNAICRLFDSHEQLRAEQKHNRLVIAQHEEHLGRVLEELTEARRLLADLNKVVIDLMLAAAPVPAQPSAESTCAWSENDDGFYETECGNSFQFIDGGAADNHATYCQYCGKKIDEHWFDDMPEGDTK